MSKPAIVLAAIFSVTAQAPAFAQEEGFEIWLNPSISRDLGNQRSLELETAQRLRDADDGRPDTYFFRLWLNQEAARGTTLSGAIERRINDGGTDETRLIQQLSTRHGIWRTRLRLEQRFVDNADQMGLRLRPRLGISVPLDEAKQWSFRSDAEVFLTLRATSPSGDEGLTGLRTQVGFGYKATDRLSVSFGYLRQQDMFSSRPDVIGHAPIIAVDFEF